MNIIGVNNPYSLIQKAGKRKNKTNKRKTIRRKHKKTRKNYRR
jgi:hypothetical protein